MRFSIRTKIILSVSLSLVLIFGLIIYLLVTRNISQLRSGLNEQAKSFASLATPPIGNTFLLYQHSGSIRITQQVDKFLGLDPDITAIRIVSVDGRQLYSSRNEAGPAVPASLAASFTAQYVKNGDGYVREVVQPFFEDSGAHRYAVVYEVSTKRVQQSVRDVVRLILYVGIAIMVISIVTTIWLLNTLFIKPLRDVSRSADIISQGRYDQQIVPKNHDEIGSLAVAVNKMAESLKANIVKLQELDKLKSEFMMIASHNLRTPLTVMRGYIEMAERAESIDELKQIIASVQDSVVRLHLLAEDLLTISSLEAGAGTMEKQSADAKAFIDSTVSEFKVLAEKKGLKWRFANELPADTKLELNQSNMRSALGNVIDNAIKFTQAGGAVDIACRMTDGDVVFTVADTGIGIQPAEMPRLFTKFHRGTSTMTYDYEGAGIGLYLTKLIIEKHGGHVGVESEVGKGSTFTVRLPLKAVAPAPSDVSEPTAGSPSPGDGSSAPPAPGGHHHAV